CAREIMQNLIAMNPSGEPRFAQLWLERHSTVHRFLNCGGRIGLAIDCIEEEKASHDSQTRPGQCEGGIELHGSRVIGGNLLFSRDIKERCLNRSPVEVSIVGCNIARRLNRESFFLGTAKFGIERVSDLASHLAFYSEDIL